MKLRTLAYTIFPAMFCMLGLGGCNKNQHSSGSLEDIAANEEVLAFMKTFDGRGALTDSTAPLTPEKSLASFRYPDDIRLELVLSEPDITQPVFMVFDHKGRLWVVQYNQYPYPKDLKVTSMDQHLRATFDRVPPPPGQGPKGADKVTFFEDRDDNGTYESSTDAVTGLNIATSVAIGRGQIWVLTPPYLVAYPDGNDDGIPDDAASVHLEGFGLEDTHAVANSLRWGPDGWLYGAQGSTCTANVSSAVSKNVRFDGQAIWRYHPGTKVFEVFAEGGGNTFDIEIDEKGRIYSGDNGTSRGQYYKQGAYYVRNFGKHGALTNPFAFGYLANMELAGEKVRFTHAFIKYEGGQLPDRYDGRMIAINPLQRYVQLSRFEENGSTFRVIDEAHIVETQDHWFRPVDITTGPDGGVYIVDWYDSRLSHVDPRDTWSKTNGRIYRMMEARSNEPPSHERFNLTERETRELVRLLSHKNRWVRQQALRVIGDRRDTALIPELKQLLRTGNDQSALEALWALNLSGGFDDNAAIDGLQHRDPFVRLWAVRLCGDKNAVSVAVTDQLTLLAKKEMHPEVRSQLAASAKRLHGKAGVSIISNLLMYHDDSADPDIPMQIWWALESKSIDESTAVLSLFEDPQFWKRKTVRDKLLERLAQRYTVEGDSAAFASCARLIDLAPSAEDVRILANGLQEGLRGTDMTRLPSVVLKALKPYEKSINDHSLALSLRQGSAEAIKKALSVIQDATASASERISYVKIFGDIYEPESIEPLLRVVENNHSSPALRISAIQALQRYEDEEIGQRIAKAYPDKLRADPGVRLAALSLFASRPMWAEDLLNAIDRKKLPGEEFIAHTISKDDVPPQIVQQLKLLNEPEITATATRLWPGVSFSTASEKTGRINHISKILQSNGGNIAAGRKVYLNSCGPCHRLFNDGGNLGPDLTGYDRQNVSELLMNIVDPGAYVREGYVTYRLTTRDGRVLLGNIAAREGTTININLLSGEAITLGEKDIKTMQPQPSIMPDKLLDNLSETEIRDLFAYLTKK